jgi:hypothetical protein
MYIQQCRATSGRADRPSLICSSSEACPLRRSVCWPRQILPARPAGPLPCAGAQIPTIAHRLLLARVKVNAPLRRYEEDVQGTGRAEWKTFLWRAMLLRPPSRRRHFRKGIAMMTGSSARSRVAPFATRQSPRGQTACCKKNCETNPITSKFLNSLALEGLRT